MYSREKLIQSALFVINSLGKVDKHKLFKILYFAEQKHLARYGRPINGNDRFVKMEYGPVPSLLFDIIKGDGGALPNFGVNKAEVFIVNGKSIETKIKVDTDYFSDSEVQCISESIMENKDLDFNLLKDKSHGFAYNNATGRSISTIDMATEAGANDEMLRYIQDNIEKINCTFA